MKTKKLYEITTISLLLVVSIGYITKFIGLW